MLRKKEILDDLEDNDDKPKSRQEILLQQLRAISKALGEEVSVSQDDLTDYWDAQLDRGEEPDLDLTVEDLRLLKEQGLA